MRRLIVGFGAISLIALFFVYQFVPLKAPEAGEATPRAVSLPEAESNEKVFMAKLSSVESSACFECHDKDVTKAFHVPEKIMKIDAGKSLRRRLCIDCHGAEGADASKQMIEERYLKYNPSAGTNGVFVLSVDVPHTIHRTKILEKEMDCIDCHIENKEEFKISFPKANVDDGQVLLCQNCKAESNPHPERGNYIAIHVEKGGKKCNICHVGDVLNIHKRATSKLGQ